MLFLLKLIIVLVVLGFMAQQASLYYAIVVNGSYIANAGIFNSMMVVAVWPLLVIVGGFAAIYYSVKFLEDMK